jgi:DNA-directed RNA polymerase subunit RPC12/RpoP
MKAIICTQCGATIDDVSESSLIITCDYCGARIMLSGPEQKPSPPVQVPPPDLRAATGPSFSPANLGIAIGVAVLLPILLLVFVFSRQDKRSAAETYAATSTPYPDPTVLPIWRTEPAEPPKPVPVVNYQPRVAWDGPNDMEHFENPEVDITSVAHLTSEEVEKTVFKNRVVKLRVLINTEGEIDEVETISGHPLLVAAATESAKRTIFSSRSKPTKRVLTYTFRVLKD